MSFLFTSLLFVFFEEEEEEEEEEGIERSDMVSSEIELGTTEPGNNMFLFVMEVVVVFDDNEANLTVSG